MSSSTDDSITTLSLDLVTETIGSNGVVLDLIKRNRWLDQVQSLKHLDVPFDLLSLFLLPLLEVKRPSYRLLFVRVELLVSDHHLPTYIGLESRLVN